jgi:hypothetical protein
VDRQPGLAVVRIEGRPAANLSFWIKRADFVREYQKVDGFWLPLKDETLVQVRFYGKKVVTIDHRDYFVRRKSTGQACGRPAVPSVSVSPAAAPERVGCGIEVRFGNPIVRASAPNRGIVDDCRGRSCRSGTRTVCEAGLAAADARATRRKALSYAGISPTAERRRTVPSPATPKHIGFTTVSGLGRLECRVP